MVRLLKASLIFIVLASSFGSVSALKITYNTTLPNQFMGEYAFERLDEVRVIFRAEPVNVLPGEITNINFAIENPTLDEHRVTIRLIELPPGFVVVEPGTEIKETVAGYSVENVAFVIKPQVWTRPRTYWYGFDVVDDTIGADQIVVNTSKLLGTYNGINVVEPDALENGVTEEPEGTQDKGFFSSAIVMGLLIAAVILILIFKGRIKG